jgi:hypothetical protein
MKSFLWTAALVFAGIWIWSRLSKATKVQNMGLRSTKPDMTVPVDTGYFFGPYIDSKTGAYLAPGDTNGAVQYPTQPIGLA